MTLIIILPYLLIPKKINAPIQSVPLPLLRNNHSILEGKVAAISSLSSD